MSDNKRAPKSKWIRRSLITLILLILLCILAGLSAPVLVRSYKDPMSGSWYGLDRIHRKLMSHAAENDGNLPSGLDDVKEYTRTWIYFPGWSPDNRPDTILVASAKPFSSKDGTRMVGDSPHRMVLSLDGRKILLKEADYQACITQQQQPGWKQTEREKADSIWQFVEDPIWTKPFPPLSKESGPEDVPGLIHKLKHKEGHERWTAANALNEVGPASPEIVPALLDALADSESGYLAATGLAVMSLQDDSIIPSLIEKLAGKDERCSYWSAVALENIGLSRAKDAIPLMIEKLSAPGDIKTTAAKALAGVGPEATSAVPALSKLAEKGGSWERKCSMIALGRIGPEAREAIPLLESEIASGEYRIDAARALWRIDPSRGPMIIPSLVSLLEDQRNPSGTNKSMGHSFFSAIELLGEIGPDARSSIPILRKNLPGGAKLEAAWALCRIDPQSVDEMTGVIAGFLGTHQRAPDRLDQQAQGHAYLRPPNPAGVSYFDYSVGRGMTALGALWQCHPEKQEALRPLLVTLLRRWEGDKVLQELDFGTRSAIPALEDLLGQSGSSDLRLLASEALQEIRTTDPGEW